jgi:hypothetical protein
MKSNSRRLSRAIEEIAAVLQEVSRLEDDEEMNEETADIQFRRVTILEEALEKIASSSTKSVASCKKIAEEALRAVTNLFL